MDWRIKVGNVWVKLEGPFEEKSWLKDRNPLYPTDCKAWMMLLYGEGVDFANCKSGIGTRWRESWIKPTITAYCSIMRSFLESRLRVKDLKLCKIMTQSIFVNSARGILKAKRNSTSFKWCLGRRNQRT